MLEGATATWLLIVAVFTSVAGMACLALAMETHWKQVHGDRSHNGVMQRLRMLGGCCLATSLALCLCVDHASMAILVWVMVLTASALVVAFALTWQPHWLRVLVWGGRWKR